MIAKNLFSYTTKTAIALGLGMSSVSNVQAGEFALNLLAGGGVIGVTGSDKITFPVNSFRTDTFDLSDTSINFAAGGGVSYDFALDSKLTNKILQDIALGVNVYYNKGTTDGTVLEYGLPDFNNSSYKMRLQTVRMMCDAEFGFFSLFKGVAPFIQAGIGGAVNTLHFENEPRQNIGASGGNYSLPNHSQLQFAYEAGAGL